MPQSKNVSSLNWEDYMVILIALEDHQAVLQRDLHDSKRILIKKQKQILMNRLTPLRRKLHAMRDNLD